VDSAHNANKHFPLLEDGVLTVSTIASAKGYDAPVVFLLGADELSGSTQDRAIFYVGTTRAKLHLVVTGVKKNTPTLLDEVVMAAKVLAAAPVSSPPPTPELAKGEGIDPKRPPEPKLPAAAGGGMRCRHCQSPRLHAQHGKFGYFFRCIDCTQNTPMEMTCPCCGKRAKIRKSGNEFHRECEHCRHAELYHVNVPLDSLFE
jgi:hypothetical protein